MPIKFEQARMKNEGGVRENVKWTYTRERNEKETRNDTRQTLGVTDAITTAVSLPQC